MRRISRLRMTGHPFILVSAVLPKSFQICLQLVNQKQEYTLSTQRIHKRILGTQGVHIKYTKSTQVCIRYTKSTQRVHKEYTFSTHCLTDERRLKGWWRAVYSLPERPPTGRFNGWWKEETALRTRVQSGEAVTFYVADSIARYICANRKMSVYQGNAKCE